MIALGDDCDRARLSADYRNLSRRQELARRHGRCARSRCEAPQRPGIADGLAGQEADSGDADAAIARVKAMIKGNPTG